MKRHEQTTVHGEKRRMLLVYASIMAVLLVMMILFMFLVGEYLYILLSFGLVMALLTFVFMLGYRNPAEWGWLMFGRGRAFSGSPWQSRVGRELTHMDAREAVEQQDEYERAIQYEKPEALVDKRELREDMKEAHRIDLPRPEPKEGKLGNGVLKCPQCQTPYVFDEDSPICVRCGTRLHRGRAQSK